MSDTEEKRYSAKQIVDNITYASITWRLVEGPEHEEVIDHLCVLFLVGFLGRETYKKALQELAEEELRKDNSPADAILAALMARVRSDNDVAGDI